MYDVDLTLSVNSHGKYLGEFEILREWQYIRKLKIVTDDKISLIKIVNQLFFQYMSQTRNIIITRDIGNFICKAMIDGKIKCDYNELKIKIGKKCIHKTIEDDGNYHSIRIDSIKPLNIKIAFAYKNIISDTIFLQNDECYSRDSQDVQTMSPQHFYIYIFEKNSPNIHELGYEMPYEYIKAKTCNNDIIVMFNPYNREQKLILEKEHKYKCNYYTTPHVEMYTCEVWMTQY
jgi:hypothetical protein